MMDNSAILSAHEFYEKYHAEEKSYDIFEEVDDGKDDQAGRRKKSAISSIPLDSAIKEPPKTHEELTKFLQEHLRITKLRYTSVDNQKQLADVLTLAITSIWPQHRKHGPDPFLSEIGNRELQRRIAVYIVQTAEELFYEYVAKAEEVNEKAVFSMEANLSRLKTQILHEANTCLNALKVRRKLVAHMRDVPDEEWFNNAKNDNAVLYPDFGPLDDKTRLKLEKSQLQFQRKQVDEITSYMNSIQQPAGAHLNFDAITADVTKKKKNVTETSEHLLNIVAQVSKDSQEPIQSSLQIIRQRSSSMPNLLAESDSSEDFMELAEYAKLNRERSVSVDQLVDQLLDENNKKKKGTNNGTDIKLDLPVVDIEDDDFSPLLQVQDMQPKKKARVVQLEEPMDDSDEDLFTDMNLVEEVEDGLSLASLRHLPQPSYVNVKVPGKGIVRISDVSVSTRINESKLMLEKYPTMYNEFLGEIDDTTVKSLDEHLFIGKQAQEVYDEITKTMNKDYLCFDQDDFVECCAPSDEDTSMLFMSSMIKDGQRANLLSEDLRMETVPPWVDYASAEEWRNHPKFGSLGREQILQMKSTPKANSEAAKLISDKGSADPPRSGKGVVPDNSFLQKSYNAWLTWYKSHLETDDYKKYLHSQESDYLCQIFHLYDSEDENPDEEENLLRKAREKELRDKQRKRREEIRSQKLHFEKGFWNAQCVSLGGLGLDPELEDVDMTENLDDFDKISDEDKSAAYIYLQERLERVWKLLKTPDQSRVDMAMKYSGVGGVEVLNEAIEYWEEVTDLIIERERLIGNLEEFERSASDPNRFFQKGPSGSSVARVNEAKTRGKLEEAIKALEEVIQPLLNSIQKRFGDTVTYQGRVYSQKIQTDRVEMLYWLQQERRQQALNAAKNVPPTSEVKAMTPVVCQDITPTIA